MSLRAGVYVNLRHDYQTESYQDDAQRQVEAERHGHLEKSIVEPGVYETCRYVYTEQKGHD